jgi:phosphoglycolate phosphatase
MTELIIFDLDGTVLDTLADLTAALNHALIKNGLPPRTAAETRTFVGNGIRKLIERGAPSGTPENVINAVHADFTAYYAEHCADATRPYPGVREMIAALRAAGMKTAVVSNKADYAVQTLAARYFPGDFDYAAGEREGVARKPAPDMAVNALRALGVAKENAVFVGDSEVDIETARNAGLRCLSVTWGFKERAFLLAHGAGTPVDSPEEITELMIND